MLRLTRIACIRYFIALCILLFTVCVCCAQVFALPDAETPAAVEPSEKWVDLQAQVPSDFKGSVSVLLQQDSTGALYTLTCYPINDYQNSMLLPTGTYTIMQTFTSEDAFLYDTFLDTESFDLQSSIQLDVSVTENPEGKAFLGELQEKQGTPTVTETPNNTVSAQSGTDTSAKENQPDPVTPEPISQPDANSSQTGHSSADMDETQSEHVPSAEDASAPEERGAWLNFLKSVLSFLSAVMILAVIFFGVYYVYHRIRD